MCLTQLHISLLQHLNNAAHALSPVWSGLAFVRSTCENYPIRRSVTKKKWLYDFSPLNSVDSGKRQKGCSAGVAWVGLSKNYSTDHLSLPPLNH